MCTIMELEWVKSSGKEDIYGIYLDRGGVKYPLATIEFAPALGRDDLERLFRAAPFLAEACQFALEQWFDRVYPPDIFIGGPSSDPGVNEVREVAEKLRAALQK